MHDYTQNEIAVNNLYQQYTMLKNAIREMGGYEADEEIDWRYASLSLMTVQDWKDSHLFVPFVVPVSGSAWATWFWAAGDFLVNAYVGNYFGNVATR